MASQSQSFSSEAFSGGPERRRPNRYDRLAANAPHVAPRARRPDQFSSTGTTDVSQGREPLTFTHSVPPEPGPDPYNMQGMQDLFSPPATHNDWSTFDSTAISAQPGGRDPFTDRFKIDSALQRAGVEDPARQSQFRSVCEDGIHSLLLFIGSRVMKLDERLEKAERHAAQHHLELKKIQAIMAENFTVGEALKTTLQDLCNHLMTLPQISYRDLAAVAEDEAWRNAGKFCLESFQHNHVVRIKVRKALNTAATESRSKMHKVVKTWASNKKSSRVRSMAQEWYNEYSMNKVDREAPNSLVALFSLLRKLKRRERSSSEETSFWTSVDEILVDCVAQYGDDRDRFTSGWTGWHQELIREEESLEGDIPDTQPAKRTRSRSAKRTSAAGSQDSLATRNSEAPSTSTDSNMRNSSATAGGSGALIANAPPVNEVGYSVSPSAPTSLSSSRSGPPSTLSLSPAPRSPSGRPPLPRTTAASAPLAAPSSTIRPRSSMADPFAPGTSYVDRSGNSPHVGTHGVPAPTATPSQPPWLVDERYAQPFPPAASFEDAVQFGLPEDWSTSSLTLPPPTVPLHEHQGRGRPMAVPGPFSAAPTLR